MIRKGKRSQLQLDELSLIDVSLEDDSLLPSADKARHGNSPHVASHPSETGSVVKILDAEQEGLPETGSVDKILDVGQEDLQQLGFTLPCPVPGEQKNVQALTSAPESALKKKKKKSGLHNLRKSLAWNHAFLTDEGVLDLEELSLLNKTFNELPDLTRPSNLKKPNRTPKRAETTLIPKIQKSMLSVGNQQILEQSTQRLDGGQIQAQLMQGLGCSSVLCSPQSSTGSIRGGGSERPDLHANRGLAATRHAMRIRSSQMQAEPVKQVKSMLVASPGFSASNLLSSQKAIDNNTKRVAGPYLPGRVRIQKGTPGFSRAVSSVSKKMDKLAITLSGCSDANQKGFKAKRESHVSVHSHSASYGDSSSEATQSFSPTPFERPCRPLIASSLESVSSNGAFCPELITLESRSSNQLEKVADKFRRISPVGKTPSHTGSASKSPAFVDAKMLSQSKATIEGVPSLSSSQCIQETATATVLPSSQKSTQLGCGPGCLPKPSGLRMPSPKLGFFDTGKAMTTSPVTVLQQRTAGVSRVAVQSGRSTVSSRFPTEVGGTINNRQGSSGLKLHDSSAKSRQQLAEASGMGIIVRSISSGIPSAPHIRGPQRSLRSLNSSSNKADGTVHGRAHTLQAPKNVQYSFRDNSSSNTEGTLKGLNLERVTPHNSRKLHSSMTVVSHDSSLEMEESETNQLDSQGASESVTSVPYLDPITQAACEVRKSICDSTSNGTLTTTITTKELPQCRIQFSDDSGDSAYPLGVLEGNICQSIHTADDVFTLASVSSSEVSNGAVSPTVQKCWSSVLHSSSKVEELVNSFLDVKELTMPDLEKRNNYGSLKPMSKDIDSLSARSPFAVKNTNVLDKQGSNNQVKKEKGSTLSLAKRTEGWVTSSPLRDGSRHENALQEGRQYDSRYQKCMMVESQLASSCVKKELDSSSVSTSSEGICSLDIAGQVGEIASS